MREVSPLPVRIEAAPGESGLGFLLRVARANGLTLASLFDALGLPKSLRHAPDGLAVLARATEVELDWLVTSTAVVDKHDGFCRADWLGRVWACSLSLRGSHPQICTDCLREGRPCVFEWELTGVVACLRHRRHLVDGCMHCGRRLNWWRPAIDVCSCGRFLAGNPDAERVGDDVVAWTAKLAAEACGDAGSVAGVSAVPDLPRWLDALSPDGLTAVVFAFGIRSDALERIASATAIVPPQTLRMAEVVARGVDRIRRVGDLSERCPVDMRLLIYEEGLQRLRRRGSVESDRRAAAGLLAWLGMRARGSRSAARPHGAGQGELFRSESAYE